jgi:hypothetical protein
LFAWFNAFILLVISLVLSPLLGMDYIWGYVVSLNGSLLAGFSGTVSIFMSIAYEIIAAFPLKVINTATILMTFSVMEHFIDVLRSGEFLK